MYIFIGENKEIEIKLTYNRSKRQIEYLIWVYDSKIAEKIFWYEKRRVGAGRISLNIKRFIFWLHITLTDFIKFMNNNPKEKIKVQFMLNHTPYLHYISLEKDKEELKEYKRYILEMAYHTFEQIIYDT
ncbi:MAG: hypothetical protein ACPL1F_07805 [bacterium]